jgi:heme-degrading monooxygenase HmoA
MIARHWHGIARSEEADNYAEHLRLETIPEISLLPGFISVSIMRRSVPGGIEFLVATRWESMDAVRLFAGSAADVAVVPQNVRAMMIRYDATVALYDVIEDVIE